MDKNTERHPKVPVIPLREDQDPEIQRQYWEDRFKETGDWKRRAWKVSDYEGLEEYMKNEIQWMRDSIREIDERMEDLQGIFQRGNFGDTDGKRKFKRPRGKIRDSET